MAEGDNLHPIGGKLLRLARAASGRHEPTSKELLLARHMAHEGATTAEIHAALGWDCVPHSTYLRLRRYGIRVRRKEVMRLKHYLPKSILGSGINMKSYRPRRTP